MAMMVLVCMLGSVLGWSNLKQQMAEVPLLRKLSASFLSDWVKAMGLLSCWPFFALFLLLSSVNQVPVSYSTTDPTMPSSPSSDLLLFYYCSFFPSVSSVRFQITHIKINFD